MNSVEKQKLINDAINFLAVSTPQINDDLFFHHCVEKLSSVYSVKYAFIALFTEDKSRIEALSFWSKDKIAKNFSHSIKNTPCSDILSLQKDLTIVDINQLYSNNVIFKNLNVNSYYGIPLKLLNSKVIGVLAICDDKKINLDNYETPVLSIFAKRIAIEIEKKQQYQKKIEHRLDEDSGSNFELMFESSFDGMLLMDKVHYFRANSAVLKMFGAESADELYNIHPSQFSPEKQPCGRLSFEIGNEIMATTLKQGYHRFEWVHKKMDTTLFWTEIFLTRLELDEKDIVLATIRDISKQKRLEKQLLEKNIELKKTSQTDGLTGLLNRITIEDAIRSEIYRVSRNKSIIFSSIMLDIDHFKHINDSYGHSEGDLVLRAISKLINNNKRKSDQLGRWGGEEFMILCPDTNLHGAMIQAEKIRKSIENISFELSGSITASFGVATYVFGEPADTYFTRIDDRLYEAKEYGRNQTVG